MPIIDQYSDPGFTKLASVPGYANLAETFSRAFGAPPTQETAYAWKEAGAFPVHTPEDAIFSLFYAVKQARVVPGEVFVTIKEACTAFGFDPAAIIEELVTPVQVKEASADEFLLPQQRRLRVKTAADVDNAVVALARDGRNLDVTSLVQASVRLVKKAADMQMRTDRLPSFIYKYAGLVESHPQTLVAWLGARADASPTLEHRAMFDKIAHVVQSNPQQRDRDELIKIAKFIGEADEKAGLTKWYGTHLLDPVASVFNTEKLAQAGVMMGGEAPMPTQALASLPPGVFADVLGPDFIEQVVDETGEIDPEMLAAVLETLPADMKQQLMAAVGPYLQQ